MTDHSHRPGDMGRPTKLTPAIRDAICADLAAGLPRGTAAVRAGIDRATFFRWMKRGSRDRSGDYRDFRDAVKKAEASAEKLHLDRITAAGATTWQASAWVLERKWPERWGSFRGEFQRFKREVLRQLAGDGGAGPQGASGPRRRA